MTRLPLTLPLAASAALLAGCSGNHVDRTMPLSAPQVTSSPSSAAQAQLDCNEIPEGPADDSHAWDTHCTVTATNTTDSVIDIELVANFWYADGDSEQHKITVEYVQPHATQEYTTSTYDQRQTFDGTHIHLTRTEIVFVQAQRSTA